MGNKKYLPQLATLQLNQFQQTIVELILDRPSPGQDCARNAINHLYMADKIKNLDPAMVWFRCITAEEEAATAIMHALKRKNYKGADKLNHRNHVHKNAVYPFLIAQSHGIEKHKKWAGLEFSLELVSVKASRRFRLRVQDLKRNESFLLPVPIDLTIRNQLTNEVYDFSEEIDRLVGEKSAASISKLVEDRANIRNKLLYASADGIPGVAGDMSRQIAKSKDRVFHLLLVYLLIDSYPIQSGVQQSLFALLKMLGGLPAESIFM
ncbi:hypothetical protein L0156_12040 [bacterium]|nr:hypothetical protein [bacterium]